MARYQIAFNDPQTDKDLEDPENRAKLLKYLYRSSSDPRPVGRFQVTENMLAGIGQNQLGSLFTEKVCEFKFLSLKYRPKYLGARKDNANTQKTRSLRYTWMLFREASTAHVSFLDLNFRLNL